MHAYNVRACTVGSMILTDAYTSSAFADFFHLMEQASPHIITYGLRLNEKEYFIQQLFLIGVLKTFRQTRWDLTLTGLFR